MSDKLINYEETHEEELFEKFIEKNRAEYDTFVFEMWNDYEADMADYMYDQAKDRMVVSMEE